MKNFNNNELSKDINFIIKNNIMFTKTDGKTIFCINLADSENNESYVYYDENERNTDFQLLTEKLNF